MKLMCKKCGKREPQRCAERDCPYFVGRPRTFKKEFSGSAPNIFVGRYGYPDVRIGMLATEEYEGNDEPKLWSAQNTPIGTIIDKRSSLINSQFITNVRSFSDRLLEQAQLVAQAKKPAHVEVQLARAPTFTIEYPPGASPHGASVKLVKSSLIENVRIPKAIDKAVSDNDLKASDALAQLYGKTDEYQLTKLLTGGVLGRKTDRKLVPTRWAITAVDDTLAKNYLEKLRELPVLGEPQAFFGGHYGNWYVILLLPRMWQYELFEFSIGDQGVWTDYEGFSGRKTYASDTAGGYYAARLPIIEKLLAMKRQAAVLCLRFVTDEYTNPLGVWVVREAVRKALDTKHITFADEALLLGYARARATKFGIHWQHHIADKSKLLASFSQKTLGEF